MYVIRVKICEVGRLPKAAMFACEWLAMGCEGSVSDQTFVLSHEQVEASKPMVTDIHSLP